MFSKSVRVSQLLNDVIVLSQKACEIIRAAHFSSQCSVYDKTASSPMTNLESDAAKNVDLSSVVTSVDLKCQKLISDSLRSLYPQAKQVGEEDSMMSSIAEDELEYTPA